MIPTQHLKDYEGSGGLYRLVKWPSNSKFKLSVNLSRGVYDSFTQQNGKLIPWWNPSNKWYYNMTFQAEYA